MNRPTLGQWCEINKEAHKSHDQDKTTWVTLQTKPQRAMYIGWRTMRNGELKYWEYGEEQDWYFQTESTVEVWLFVTNPRHNPIYAFPADVAMLKDSE